jgi:dolichol-phosphate mannosyltransferase
MVSIVIPAWNEEDIIERCLRQWFDEVLVKIPFSEIVIVDDCSSDRTAMIADNLVTAMSGVRCIRSTKNTGHGPALRTGFDHASQPFIFQTDSDLQITPSDFWRLWEKRNEAEFILGTRSRRADGVFRLAISCSMLIINATMWGLWIRDANCPFKLMRREALNVVLADIPRDCFAPMVLVSVLSRKMGFHVLEVEVDHLARNGGTQSLKGLAKWISVCYLCMMQFCAVRWSWWNRTVEGLRKHFQ